MKNIPSILLLLFLLLLVWKFTNLKESFYQWQYDKTTGQTIVTTQQGIDKVLNQYLTVPFEGLPEEFIQQTKYNTPKYKKLAKNATFRIIQGKDIYQFLVGDFRIKDFLPRDNAYYCLLYTSPSPRDQRGSRMPSSA